MNLQETQQQEDRSLWAEVKTAQREYMFAAAAYDAALSDADLSAQGTPEKIEHLNQARTILDEMMTALQRYQSAIARFTETYFRNGRSART